MRLNDDLSMKTGTSYTDETVAFVVKTPDDLECTDIGVFSPKLTPALTLGQTGIVEDVLTSNLKKCVNSKPFVVENDIIVRNWIRVSPKTLTNITPPKFVRGDIVFIGFIDDDIKTPYYSVSTLNYNGHRKNDDVRFFVPASPKPNVVLTKDNTYFLELNSLDDKQRIVLSTNNKNGEKCKHYLMFDSANGVMSLTDEVRSFNISYDDDSIVLKNENDSSIILKKDTITLKAKHIKIDGTDDIEINSKNMKIDVDSTSFKGKSYESEHNDIDINSKSINVDSSLEEHKISSKFAVNGSGRTHIDHSVIGLNGETIIRNFVIGYCTDINFPVIKTNGDSGPPGISMWTTGTGSGPLVKYSTFASIIGKMCAYIDSAMASPVPVPPMAMATVLPELPSAATTKILSS